MKFKIKHHRWINIAASATFGVYLIHDNNYMRHFLWIDFFNNANYQDSLLLIPYSIIVVIMVYVSCTAIELLRQYTIEKISCPILYSLAGFAKKHILRFNTVMLNLIYGKRCQICIKTKQYSDQLPEKALPHSCIYS